MILLKENLQLPIELITIIPSKQNENVLYGITKNSEIVTIDITTKAIETKIKVDKTIFDLEKSLQAIISPTDRYIALASVQYGVVYDLHEGKQVMLLDRGDYRTENSLFSLHFFQTNGEDYLVHATDWNRVEITHLQTKQMITQRHETEEYKTSTSDYWNNKTCSLNYFYGSLYASPNNQFILSSGWVWGAASVIYYWDLQKWLKSNKFEPEASKNARIQIGMSNYWDRAICWLDDATFAYLYDPREEGKDEEEDMEEDLAHLKVARDKGYILCYSVTEGKFTKAIEFENFSRNEYFEATYSQLHFNKYLYCINKDEGLSIVDISLGKILYTDKTIKNGYFSPISNKIFSLEDGKKITIMQFEEA